MLASEPAAESREGTRRWVECSWEGGGECCLARRLVGCCSGGGCSARVREQGREVREGVEEDEGTTDSKAPASKSSSSSSSSSSAPSRLPRRLDSSLAVLLHREELCLLGPSGGGWSSSTGAGRSKQSSGVCWSTAQGAAAQGVETTQGGQSVGLALAAAFWLFAKAMNAASVHSEVSASFLGRTSGVCERRSLGGAGAGMLVLKMGSGLLLAGTKRREGCAAASSCELPDSPTVLLSID